MESKERPISSENKNTQANINDESVTSNNNLSRSNNNIISDTGQNDHDDEISPSRSCESSNANSQNRIKISSIRKKLRFYEKISKTQIFCATILVIMTVSLMIYSYFTPNHHLSHILDKN